MMFPDYRRSDGHRTRIGDALVNRLPYISIHPGVVLFGRAGSKFNAAHCQRPWVKYSKRCRKLDVLRRLSVAPKPWGMSRVYGKAFGIYWGKP